MEEGKEREMKVIPFIISNVEWMRNDLSAI